MKGASQVSSPSAPAVLVARSAFVLLGGRVISACLSLVGLMLLGSHLTRAEFGLYSYVVTLFCLFNVLIGFGGNVVATAEMARAPAHAPQTLGALLSLRFCLATVAVFIYGALIVLTEEGRNRGSLLLVAPFLLGSGLAGMEAYFHSKQKMRIPVTSQLLSQAVNVLILIWLCSRGKLTLLTACLLTAAALGFGHAITFLRGLSQVRPHWVWSLKPALSLLKTCYPQGVATVFCVLYFHLDTVMLRHMKGAEETATYGAGYRVFSFCVMMPTLVAVALLPELSRGRDSFLRMYGAAFQALLTFGLTSAVIMLMLSKDVLDLIYPAGKFDSTAPVLQVLFFAFAGVSLGAFASASLVALGKQKVWAWITFVGLILNLGMNFFLIPRHGALGAAVATCGTEGFVAVAGSLLVWRIGGCGPRVAGVGEAVVVAAAGGTIAWLLRGQPFYVWISGLALAGALFIFLRHRPLILRVFKEQEAIAPVEKESGREKK